MSNWKIAATSSWLPNILGICLLAWLVITNDTIPAKNAAELQRLEQQIATIQERNAHADKTRMELIEKIDKQQKTLDERTPFFDQWKKEHGK